MGFQWRGRTNGSTNWWNASASNNGIRVSKSIKFGRTTINLGSDGKVRGTFNFGNGLRFVKTRTFGKGKKSAQPSTDTFYDAPSEEIIAVVSTFVIIPILIIALHYTSISFLASLAIACMCHFTIVFFVDRRNYLLYAIPFIFLVTPIGWLYIFLLYFVTSYIV